MEWLKFDTDNNLTHIRLSCGHWIVPAITYVEITASTSWTIRKYVEYELENCKECKKEFEEMAHFLMIRHRIFEKNNKHANNE